MENMDFRRSSRQAWSTIRKLGAAKQPTQSIPQTTPNQIAQTLKKNSSPNIPKHTKSKVKVQLQELLETCTATSRITNPVSAAEVSAAIKTTKTSKAPGTDKILPEFLKHLGPLSVGWLANLFSVIILKCKLPKPWKTARVVALLKPGKKADDPASYRPISLLCTTYKLFERELLARMTPAVELHLPIEQAGFRPNRSCCDQVLALTSHIEAGFQQKLKSVAVFIDLSSAFDTVWKQGLLFKLTKIFKCRHTYRLFDSILSNRVFQVGLNGIYNKRKILNNGVPQGSVLAPTLFNIYVSDIPKIPGRCFMYADDVAITAQAIKLTAASALAQDAVSEFERYFCKWGLRPNPSKTVNCCFHLNNRQANEKAKITFCNEPVKHDSNPVYLGVTLDRSLTFHAHLQKVKKKVSTRCGLIRKLAATTWGCKADALRTSTLALVHSVAEYCAPVWAGSHHTELVDVEINSALRTISGTVRPTNTEWLPVISNIFPSDLRRELTIGKEYDKIINMPNLPITSDLEATRNKNCA